MTRSIPTWITRGPEEEKVRRPPLTHDRVISASLKIADEFGIAELTMRRLAQDLEVSTSSLYWRYRDKNELLLSLADAVLSEIEPPSDTSLDWREQLLDYAASFRAAVHAHPNVAATVLHVLTVSPGVLRFVEGVLTALRMGGFRGDDLRHAYNSYMGFLTGYTDQEMARTISDEWAEQMPAYVASLPADLYPSLAESLELLQDRVFGLRWSTWSTGSLEDSFWHGLNALLNGLTAERSRSGARRR